MKFFENNSNLPSFENASAKTIITANQKKDYSGDHKNFNDLRKATNLGELDLQGANLSFTQIADANLSEKDLSNAKFNQSTLDGTILPHAILENATFSNTRMENVDLEHANLTNTVWSQKTNVLDTKLTDADASGAKIRSSTFERIEASRINLDNSEFFAASFIHSNFENATFKHSRIRGESKIERSNLKKVDFSHSTITSMSFYLSNLSFANFHKVKFSMMMQKDSVSFNGAILYKANLKNIQLTRFRSINFNDAILIDAEMSNDLKEKLEAEDNAILTSKQLNKKIKDLELRNEKNQMDIDKLFLFRHFRKFLTEQRRKEKEKEKISIHPKQGTTNQLITSILNGHNKPLTQKEKDAVQEYLRGAVSWVLKESEIKKLKNFVQN